MCVFPDGSILMNLVVVGGKVTEEWELKEQVEITKSPFSVIIKTVFIMVTLHSVKISMRVHPFCQQRSSYRLKQCNYLPPCKGNYHRFPT